LNACSAPQFDRETLLSNGELIESVDAQIYLEKCKGIVPDFKTAI
jgi:hypothetical protein